MKATFQRVIRTFAVTAAAATASSPATAHACAVCFGDPASPLTKGADAGVMFLLGVVVVVLSMFASLFLYWMRRSRMNRLQLEGMVE